MAKGGTFLLACGLAACGLEVLGADGTQQPPVSSADASSPAVGEDAAMTEADGATSTLPQEDAASQPDAARRICVKDVCSDAHRVFVTSQTFNGNLGGVEGADAKCQNAANTAGLGGVWRSWTTVTSNSPNARFVKATIPYVMLDGKVVAASYAALIGTADIDNAIDADETGKKVPTSFVWTHTRRQGTEAIGLNCQGFTDTDGDAYTGLTDKKTDHWTAKGSENCDQQGRLYCFEQ